MANVAGHDWPGFGPAGSAADLFNPIDFEARLVEARARRREVLANRVENPGPAPPPDLRSRAPDALARAEGLAQGLIFLAGLVVGLTAAATTIQAIRPGAPPPYVGAPPAAPMWPAPSSTISLAVASGAGAPAAGLPILAAIAADPGPGMPRPSTAGLVVASSKARTATLPEPLAPLRLQGVQSAALIAGGAFGPAASGDGVAVAAFDRPPALDAGIVSERPRLDRPAIREPDPPRAAKPRPSERPEQLNPAPQRDDHADRSSSGAAKPAGRREKGTGAPARAVTAKGRPDDAHARGRGHAYGRRDNDESARSESGKGGKGASRNGNGGGKGANGNGRGGGNNGKANSKGRK
jgi:hypothetical protein